MRKPLIAGNWKMFKTQAETRDTLRRLDQLIGRAIDVEVLICPPFTSLPAAREAAAGTVIQIGAQNLHWEEEGALTGEVSAAMLLDCGCSHVLIGHSERRQLFGEEDQGINRKLKKVLSSELIPVLCVGESLLARESERVEEVVEGQLEQGLTGLTAQEISRIIVAYEPVWAIGTGKTATPEIAQQAHAMIRGWFERNHSSVVADGLRILYGGSVQPGNVAGLMAQPDIDGALVGGASLEADSFAALVGYRR
ncbi:MAG: triose-phosphate isomerase [Acidobacteriota bacterium]